MHTDEPNKDPDPLSSDERAAPERTLAAARRPPARVAAAESPSIRSDRLRQAVLDALPAQVVVLDANGRIIAVNAAWQRFADQNDGDAALREGIGIDYLAVCRNVTGDEAEQAQRVADGILAVIERRELRFVHEYPCHSPNQRRWMALSAAPLEDDSRGAVVFHLDITERKQAEHDARQARESMAQAARLNAVGILAASLIHELAQPLSAAAFFSGTAVSMLEQGDVPAAKLTRLLTGVDGQIHRASATVQRLRDFLRRQEMRLRPVAIDDIVLGATELVRWFAADHNVRVRYVHSAPDVQVMADMLQLEQVLVNLVCNSIQAIDAADTARRLVSIGVERIVQNTRAKPAGQLPPAGTPRLVGSLDAGGVQVTVHDTGPGLPDSDAEELFNIFTSTKSSGLGLGLAISRDIVELHGGRLWAEPAPCEGACFHFTLPLAADREP